MLHIAINVLPLKTGHKVRGIGSYTRNLIETLKKDHALSIREFEELSELKDVDVVHYPWFDLFFHTLPLKHRFPTVVTIHDVIPLVFPERYPKGLRGKINFILQKVALKGCKFIITDSQISKMDIIKHLRIGSEKIVVIPLAQDSNFKVLTDAQLIRTKRKYHLPDDFLLYVGDCGWNKNLSFLVEGFRQLIRLPNLDKLKLILVGGVFLKNVENIDHPELASLKIVNRLIKQYGLEDKILRPGNLEAEELVAFYNLATIYVQPSFYEGFGLPILEAFACGTPVISSNRGSLSEVGGEAAVYFDPENLDQFKSEVLEILQNRSLQNKLSKLGLKQAAKFSWDRVARETKQVYTNAINAGAK